MGLMRRLTPKVMGRIQAEHQIWADAQFGPRPPFYPLLGIIEEIGELAHAELKSRQKIRGTPAEHRAAIIDAMCDTLVFLCDLGNQIGGSLSSVLESRPVEIPSMGVVTLHIEDDSLHAVCTAASRLVLKFPGLGGKEFGDLMIALDAHATRMGVDLNSALIATWEIVKQRDWKKYPKTGHQEAEAPLGEHTDSNGLTASGILSRGLEILNERGKQYGDGAQRERNMVRIVQAFEAMTGVALTPAQGWLFMVALKGVRAGHGGGVDAFIDGANYFALAGEERELKLPKIEG